MYGLDAKTENVVKDVINRTDSNGQNPEKILKEMGFKKRSANDGAPKEISLKEKSRRLQLLVNKFPDLTRDAIKMALEAANYETEICEALLKSQKGRKRVAVKFGNQKRKEEPKPATNFAPVVFGAEEPAPVTTANVSKPTPTTSSAASSSSTTVKKVKTKVTAKRQKVLATVDTNQNKTSSHRLRKNDQVSRINDYKSKLCTKPVGPNSQLCAGPNSENYVGPNKDLLLPTYTQSNGPNPTNYAGAQKEHRKGPDSENYKGRSGMNVGPAKNNML